MHSRVADDVFSGCDVSRMKEYITVKEIKEYFGEKAMTNEELIKENAEYKNALYGWMYACGVYKQALIDIVAMQPNEIASRALAANISTPSEKYLYQRLEEYKYVVDAAVAYVGSDMYVHPILSREEAVKLGADKLIDAVNKFNSLQGQQKIS